MVAKLSAYRTDDDWEYEELQEVMTFIYNGSLSTDTKIFVANGATRFLEVDGQWGLRYRTIETFNSDSQPTQALILDWTGDFLIIKDSSNVGGWTNGAPVGVFSTVRTPLVISKPYMDVSPTESIDISEDIIEDTLQVSKEIESIKKLDLIVSSATFSIDKTVAIETFLDTYWTAEKVGSGEDKSFYTIGVEIEDVFWGYVSPENIIYDVENDTYIIDAYDWVKFCQETKWNNYLPAIKTPNLYTFLIDNLVKFPNKGTVIDVGQLPHSIDALDYRAYFVHKGDVSDWLYRSLRDMSVNDFMVELFKHYNAVLYYDTNGRIVFRNRSSVNTTEHTDVSNTNIEADTLVGTYRVRDYQGIVITVKGEWRFFGGEWGQYEGYVLLWEEDNELQVKGVNSDLSNIQENFKFLDLRQNFNGLWHEYIMFFDRERIDVYNSYRELISHQPTYELTVDGLGYNLYDRLRFSAHNDGSSLLYRIISVIEDHETLTSELIVEKYHVALDIDMT